ncbi:MAG: hypothetical protein ACO3V7_05850, partial [Burkholderiaceae bacterium]
TAFCFAAYAILTRKLSGRDPATPTLFIGALVATLLFSLIAPGYWLWPTSILDWFAFFTMGAIGAYGHHLMVKAYAAAPVSTLAPYSYAHGLAGFRSLPRSLVIGRDGFDRGHRGYERAA